jgi:inner membrane protein
LRSPLNSIFLGPRSQTVPSVITHPAVALGLAPYFRRAGIGPRVWALGAACAVVPDLDAIGFRLGIPYDHPLGHRGLTHSVTFALVLAGVLAAVFRRSASLQAFPWSLFAYLFLCCVSHGVLDAFTNGGLGVAFLAPCSNERFSFPWRPIAVAPLSIARFFSGRAVPVLTSELQWVVAPSALLGLIGLWLGRTRA